MTWGPPARTKGAGSPGAPQQQQQQFQQYQLPQQYQPQYPQPPPGTQQVPASGFPGFVPPRGPSAAGSQPAAAPGLQQQPPPSPYGAEYAAPAPQRLPPPSPAPAPFPDAALAPAQRPPLPPPSPASFLGDSSVGRDAAEANARATVRVPKTRTPSFFRDPLSW